MSCNYNSSREQHNNFNDGDQFHSNLSQQKRFYLQSCLNEDITPHVAVIQLFHKAELNMEAYIDMDLSNQSINDTDILPLIKMLSVNKDKWVLSLNLSDNRLEQAACFFDLISDNNALEALFLNKNYFSPNHLEKLNRFALSAKKSIFIDGADQRKLQSNKTLVSPAKTTLLREQILEKISSTKNQKIKRSQGNICVSQFNQLNMQTNSGFLADQAAMMPISLQEAAPLSTQNSRGKQSMFSEKNSQSAQINKLIHYLDLKKTMQKKRLITENIREQDKSHSPSSYDKFSLVSSFSHSLSKNNQSISLSTCNQQQNSFLSSNKAQDFMQYQSQINSSNQECSGLNQQGKYSQKLIANLPENKNMRNQFINPAEATHSLSQESSPHSQSEYYHQHSRIGSIPQQLFQESHRNGSTFDDGFLESFRKQTVLANKGKISGSQTYRERTAAEENKTLEPKMMMSRMDWLLEIRRIFDTMENEGQVSKQSLLSEIISNRKQFRQMSQEEYSSVKKGEQGMSMEELVSQISKINDNYLSIDQLFNLIGCSPNPATCKNKSTSSIENQNKSASTSNHSSNNKQIHRDNDKQTIEHEFSAVFDPSLFKKKYFPSTSTPRINSVKISATQDQNQANNSTHQQRLRTLMPQLNITEINNHKEAHHNSQSSKTQSTSLVNSARQKYDGIQEFTSFQSPQTTKNAKNRGLTGSEGGHEFKSNVSTTASKGYDSCESNKRVSDRSASLNMEITSPSKFHFTNPQHYQSNSLISTPQQTKNGQNLAELNHNSTQQGQQQKNKKSVHITPLNSSICENNSSSNTTAKFFKKDSLSSLSNGPASTKAAQEKISPLRQQLRQLGLSGSPFAAGGESNFKKFCSQASPASLFQFKGQGSNSPTKGQAFEGKDGTSKQKFGKQLTNDKLGKQLVCEDLQQISKLAANNLKLQQDQNEQPSISPSSNSKKGKRNDLSAFSFSESSCAVLQQQGYEDNLEKYSSNNIRKKLIPYEEGFTIDKHSEELEESLTDFIARQGLNQQENSVKNNESNQQISIENSSNHNEKPSKSHETDSKNANFSSNLKVSQMMKGKKLSYEASECKLKKQNLDSPEEFEVEKKISEFEFLEENMLQKNATKEDCTWLQSRQEAGDVSRSGGFFGCDASLEDIDELKQIVETISEQINQTQHQEQNEKILKIIQQACQYTRINMDDSQLQQQQQLQPSMQQYSGHQQQEQLYGVRFHEIDYELLNSNLLKQYFQKISALSITGIILNHMNDSSKLIRYLMENQILHKNLRILNLAGNDLTSLEQLSFAQFPNMEFINIGYNRIQSLNGISSMVNLIELHAPHNRINFIQANDLKPLKQLEQVDLTNNFFPSLDSLAALQSNTQLRYLNLQGNPLTTSAHYPKQVAKLLVHITTIDIPDVNLIPKLSNYVKYEDIAFVNQAQAAKFLVEQKNRFLMSLSPKSLRQNELDAKSNCFSGGSQRNQASSIMQPLSPFSSSSLSQGNEAISLSKNQCFSSLSKQSASQSPKLFALKEYVKKDQQLHSQEPQNKIVNQQPLLSPSSFNFSQSTVSSQNSYFPNTTGKVLPSLSRIKERHCIPENLIDNYFSSDQIKSTTQASSQSTPLSLPSPRINSIQQHNHLNSKTKSSLIKQLISTMNKNNKNVLGIYDKANATKQQNIIDSSLKQK